MYTAWVLDIDIIVNFKDNLRVSSSDRCRIEDPRQQSSSKEWFLVFGTSSTDYILHLWVNTDPIQENTLSPLPVLYPKPIFDPLPAAIAWGRQNESVACRSTKSTWLNMVTKVSQHILVVSFSIQLIRAGLEHHQMHRWSLIGIAEFKYPYTKQDQSPYELCADAAFCSELVDGQFHLKCQHHFFHQV